MNLNENATQYDVFITTSVLLAGNSIDKSHFNKCYVFVGDKSDNPKSIHQMIKRVRNLKDKHIITHISYCGHIDHKYDIVDINQWLKCTKEYMGSPNQWFNVFDYNEHGILEHKKNFNFDLLARYKQQQMNKNCFASWFIGLCYENKYIVNADNKITNSEIKNDHSNNKKLVKKEYFETLIYVDIPTIQEYEQLKLKSENDEEKAQIDKFIFAAAYNLLDKPEVHEETINNIEFIDSFFSPKVRKQHKFLRKIAFTADTYDDFINFINCKIKLDYQTNTDIQNYEDIERCQKLINGLNDIFKCLGYKNFGDVENKVVDGPVLKTIFDNNKDEILKLYSIFYYQMKLIKKDYSKFDFSKFIQSFNIVLEELTSGQFKNISESKKHDIKYKKIPIRTYISKYS